MILIVCVDDGLGMAFNHRRQSQDRLLRERLLARTAGRTLWMSAYSARQFGGEENIRVAEDCLACVGAGECCLVETQSPQAYVDRVEQIWLYRWNRSYPADLRFAIPLEEWQLTERVEFAGHSHETISEEIYTR